MLRVRWAGDKEARTASASVVFGPGFRLCIGVSRWCICTASQCVGGLYELQPGDGHERKRSLISCVCLVSRACHPLFNGAAWSALCHWAWLGLLHLHNKNETEPEQRRVHTKFETSCTVSQGVRIKSLVMLRIWRGKKVARQCSLIGKLFFFGMWISTVEMMKERASCVQRLISTVKRRAKK